LDECMDGWVVGGWLDEWMGGWMDGLVGGGMVDWVDECKIFV